MGKIIIVTAVILFIFIILFIGFLGVVTPDGGCPYYIAVFTQKLREKYEKIAAEDCGYAYSPIRQGNITLVYGCLQKAMDECKSSKAFIAVQGFERKFEYLYLTNKDCKVQITRGGCGAKTDTCDVLVPFDAMTTPNWFKSECKKYSHSQK